MAERLGISVRQAYRLTASTDRTSNRRSEQQALLARYILLKVPDPGYASAMTVFLDDFIHTLIENANDLEPSHLDPRWARTAAKHVADHVVDAVQRREQRLYDSLEIQWGKPK
jgi:hypothetical protein